MTFHNANEFTGMVTDLKSVIMAAASEYFVSKNLPPLDTDALNQMSVDLDSVITELIMFGADAWPESARPEPPVFSPCKIDTPLLELLFPMKLNGAFAT